MRTPDGLPVVAIVGRPNVGKSTLFNRVLGRRLAVVHDEAGVTRDRNHARAVWNEREFWIVDTGGFTLREGKGIELEIQAQVELAIDEADLVLLLLDARAGLTAPDEDVIRSLLRRGKAAVVAANKADRDVDEREAQAIVPLGLGAVLPVSAANGRGMEDLRDELVRRLPAPVESAPADEREVAVAIVGRPNVGKSSLVNALTGEPTMIVSEQAGTTRDAVDTWLTQNDRPFRLIDTAGLRRRSRVKPSVEYWAGLRSSEAIRRSDVVVLVLDATQQLSQQDVAIAAEAVEEYKSVILAVNKWDALEKDPDVARRFEDRIAWHFKVLSDAPVLYVSAKTGRRVDRILPAAAKLAEVRSRRVPTAEVNEVLQRIVEQNPPPSGSSRRATRVLYASQVAARPPTFAVFTNSPENLEGHYTRYLRNRIKEELGFEGAPVKVVVRNSEGREET
ncbi:MAG: ribosome biogenesis GTPase Der [Candidatus Eiseniibacteriota bacterium]